MKAAIMQRISERGNNREDNKVTLFKETDDCVYIFEYRS